MTASSGCRVLMRSSFRARITSIAPMLPTSPSKFPPCNTESICEPKSSVGNFSEPAQPEDIPGRINPYFKPRLPHQPCDILPCSQIGFRKTEASDTTLRVSAEPGQLFKRALEALRVDMKRRKVSTLGVPANRAEQQKYEAAKIAHRPDILDVQE